MGAKVALTFPKHRTANTFPPVSSVYRQHYLSIYVYSLIVNCCGALTCAEKLTAGAFCETVYTVPRIGSYIFISMCAYTGVIKNFFSILN